MLHGLSFSTAAEVGFRSSYSIEKRFFKQEWPVRIWTTWCGSLIRFRKLRSTQLMFSVFNIILIVHHASRSNNCPRFRSVRSLLALFSIDSHFCRPARSGPQNSQKSNIADPCWGFEARFWLLAALEWWLAVEFRRSIQSTLVLCGIKINNSTSQWTFTQKAIVLVRFTSSNYPPSAEYHRRR